MYECTKTIRNDGLFIMSLCGFNFLGVSSALFLGFSVDVATPHGADALSYGASEARPTGVPAPVGMPRLLGGVL